MLDMRILAVSDEVVGALYSERASSLVGPVDMLIGCGDLSYSYMEYLVTNLRVRDAFFVHGNHDVPECSENCTLYAPGGWQNVDQRVKVANGLIIAGLEGSIRYKPHAPYQYSEREMTLRAMPLVLRLLFNRVRYGRYLDVLIAHSPAQGIHDGPDMPHRGFRIFLYLMQRFRPRIFLHGHKHHYGPGAWRTKYAATQVVNVYPFRLIQLDKDSITFGKHYL